MEPKNLLERLELMIHIAHGTNCNLTKIATPDAEKIFELLKKQEPIVATWYQVDSVFGLEDGYKCGACNAEIDRDMRYCPWCGRKVKWDA